MKEDAQISRFMTADQWIKVDIVEMGPLWDRIRRHHPSYDAPQSAMLAAQKDKVKREEITKITHENGEWRLKKHILPHFGKLKLAEVDYFFLRGALPSQAKQRKTFCCHR